MTSAMVTNVARHESCRANFAVSPCHATTPVYPKNKR